MATKQKQEQTAFVDPVCWHFCVACGAGPCQRRSGHDDQHECINCGTRWWTEIEESPLEDDEA
jgi:hypothetical protein